MSHRSGGTWLGASVAMSAVMLVTACGGGGTAQVSEEECENYPEKESTFVIGRSPGGGHDEYGRFFAPLLEKRLGSSIVVKNVEGAGGRVAASQVYQAEPDGYTVHLLEPNGLGALQAIQDVEYDITKYTHLGIMNERPSTFAVSAKSDLKTFDDLVEAGKQRKLKFATSGLTSPNFVNGVIAASEAGIKFTPVPHEGSAEAIASVVRGDTDYTMFSGDSIAEAVDAGDLRALVQFGSKPLDVLGRTPMAEDVGLKQLGGVLTTNLVLVAPPDMPSCIKKKLSGAVQKTLNSEKFAAIEKQGRIVSPGTPEESRQLAQKLLEAYKKYDDTYRNYLTG